MFLKEIEAAWLAKRYQRWVEGIGHEPKRDRQPVPGVYAEEQHRRVAGTGEAK